MAIFHSRVKFAEGNPPEYPYFCWFCWLTWLEYQPSCCVGLVASSLFWKKNTNDMWKQVEPCTMFGSSELPTTSSLFGSASDGSYILIRIGYGRELVLPVTLWDYPKLPHIIRVWKNMETQSAWISLISMNHDAWTQGSNFWVAWRRPSQKKTTPIADMAMLTPKNHQINGDGSTAIHRGRNIHKSQLLSGWTEGSLHDTAEMSGSDTFQTHSRRGYTNKMQGTSQSLAKLTNFTLIKHD